MNAPRDNDLNRMYDVFKQDHDRLRQRTMASLAKRSQSHRPDRRSGHVRKFIGVTIMRSRVTKLATAAIIAVALVLAIRGGNGTTVWADVVKALNGANSIYIVTKITRPGGQIDEYRTWLKDGTMLREEDPNEITIDDGENRLLLDLEQKTAQLSDSRAPFENYMETGNQEIILLFMGRETPFTATELTKERTATERVFRMTYRDIWEGQAWVDARSNLPLRIWAEVTEKYRDGALDLEITYSYEPIAPEMFDLTVPPGYTELPRVEPRMFSGKVVNEEDRPVAGADVVTSNERIRGKTNERGEFAIKLHPGRGLGGFPMMVRAAMRGDPNRVAWTLLRNPRHELRPLFTPDDGRSKLEQGGGIDIHLVDEKSLRDFLPPDPGAMVFRDATDRYPSEVSDIVLTMRPARVITGRITDREGRPIANAPVWMQSMEITAGENEIWVHELGRTDEEEEVLSSLGSDASEEVGHGVLALTDGDGRYVLGSLPDVWHRARLEIMATGYVKIATTIFRNEGNDFTLTAGDITIRGTVIDDHGHPLVGREIEIDVDSDEEYDFDVEEVLTDAEGRFELTGMPAIDGLEVQIRTDEKPRDWEESELTRGRPFIYYLMIEEPITLQTGKKEYSVNIVAPRPDITLEIEVRDAEGNPLEGIPVGVCSPGNTERLWYVTKLNGRTDRSGLCAIAAVPRIKPLELWIGGPPAGQTHYWEDASEVNQDVRTAITECSKRYLPTVVTVEWAEGKKKYRISATLQAGSQRPNSANPN